MDADTERKYIWLISFLEERQRAECLWKMFLKRRPGAETDAILAGYNALWCESMSSLRNLINCGQLLFAFDGTTVLKGGAA